jgi:superfamily II DNA or RNA helicase
MQRHQADTRYGATSVEMIDNINKLLGTDLKQSLDKGAKLKIAASCFSIYAYEALKKELSGIEGLEFVFTAPTFVPAGVTDKISKQRREFFIPQQGRESSLYGSEFEIQLKNQLTQRAVARECAQWLRRKACFKSSTSQAPMQKFACIEAAQGNAVYTPLDGFTAVDLGYKKGDAVSNFVHKITMPEMTSRYLSLFDQLWNDDEKLQDVTEAICEHIESVYQENSPERVYFIILYNIFNEFLQELDEDVLPNDRTGYQDTVIWNKLFNFQRDAATGIINKLETYNGCILADSVGLGKTFSALAVIKYYELRNRSVLVLCPKKLADNWLAFKGNLTTNILFKDRLNYDVLCHTDLSRDSGESFGMKLNQINWGNYDLVVIDESHNFRNNPAVKERETRYERLMRQVVREGVKTKVLMLSATPVNNRFSDLKNQLALAYEGDTEAFSKHLHSGASIDTIFKNAQAAFNRWQDLEPEQRTAQAILDELSFDFFELLDSVTIARSRKHIQTFYDTSEIGQFPERRVPLSYRCAITNRDDVMNLNQIVQQLVLLKLAVYAPISYILPSRLKKYEELYDTDVEQGGGKLKQVDREKSLQALMTTNLLKRLESSVHAFRLTLGKLLNVIETTLDKIDAFEASGAATGGASVGDWSALLDDLEGDDDDIAMPEGFTVGGKVKINLADMDLLSWGQELRADREIIKALHSNMQKVTPDEDTKLQHLRQHVLAKLQNPINPGNRKVLIFTAFADTADYLYEQLAQSLPTVLQGLHLAEVTGTGNPRSTLKSGRKGYDLQEVLTLFSPKSKSKAQVLPNEPAEIDILIATDCISEGQNLQDCDYLINYDIHWNPVRIVQRFGRIDRIGSPNASIQLVNYWPDITLDEYINLKERVESRMTIVDVTATGDDNVLTSQSNDVDYRREQLRKLQDEVIELEDVRTGISITDLGLNDFRMDLLNYVKANGDLSSVPKGLHAVVPANPTIGLHPGLMFALKSRKTTPVADQHNRLHPYYLIYISEQGDILASHFEAKRLLDLMRSACKGRPDPVARAYRPFNKLTGDGREMQHCTELLNQALSSMVELKADKDLDSLFTGSSTTALVNAVQGQDDFELVAFIAVQDVSGANATARS